MACKDCGHMSLEEKQMLEEGKVPSYHAMTMYGHCPNCTPQKLNETLEAILDMRIDAGREWETKMTDKKKAYINKKTASIEKKALRIYNSKRPAGHEEITDIKKLM